MRNHLKTLLLCSVLAAVAIPAVAQVVQTPGVSQTGSVTAGDFATWASNGVIQDGSAASIVTTGNITAAAFIPSSSVVPTDGIYLPAANTTGIADRSLGVAQFTTPASAVNQFIFTGSATGTLTTLALGGSGSDTNPSLLVAGKGVGTVYLGGSTAANAPFSAQAVASGVNQIVATGSATGNLAKIWIAGSGADANASFLLAGNGVGKVYLGGTTAANAAMQVAPVASSVNQLIATATATAGLTSLAVGGSGADATAPALFAGNSTGAVYLGGTTAANAALQAQTVASSVNQIVVTSAATGNVPSIALGGTGSDANRNLKIAPSGTGVTLFGTAGTSNGGIALSGSTSGTTTIQPAAVASGALTLPAITGAVVAKGVPVACGGTCTLGAANKNTYTRLDTAAGSVATLPTATGTGDTYLMYVSVANSSNSDKVLLATVTDTIIGTAQGQNAGTAKVFPGNASTYHSIQMPFAGTQPSGGFIGDTITCTDVASTVWKCDIMYQAGTTPTTPYSASTT